MTSSASWGIAFLVSGGIVYEIIAFCCSSPQTLHLNAKKRAPTSMMYVHIGQGLSAVEIGLASAMDRKHAAPILAGGIFAMVFTEGLYRYAKHAGLNDPGEPTEEW
jgi:hypothetical protein